MLKFTRYFSLSKQEKRLFLQALRLLVIWRFLMWKLPLEELLNKVEKKSKPIFTKKKIQAPSALRIGQLMNAAARIVPCSTCLAKSLAGKVLFAQNGYAAKLHIGVARYYDLDFNAHAWLSVDGKVVLGALPDLENFAEIPIENSSDKE
jgi:hypothetical protein